jgi:hypothetical protein
MIENKKLYIPDFKIKDLKSLPMDIIQNYAFSACTGNYYKKLHKIMGDLDTCKPVERITE